MSCYRISLFLIITLYANSSLAWNSATHKIITEITWQLLAPNQRDHLSEILSHHPRYKVDLLQYMPLSYTGTEKQQQWAFNAAAVWPDKIAHKSTALRKRFNQPTWHYINLPIFIDNQKLSIDVNLSTEVNILAKSSFNIVQALQYNVDQLHDISCTPAQKALALSWILHLVGDIHQPLHAASLFSTEQFMHGDRGGNFIAVQRILRSSNLHSVWDSLLGRAKSPRLIGQKARLLMQNKMNGTLAFQPQQWSQESHQLAIRHVYTPGLLTALRARPSSNKKIRLSNSYMRQAKKIAEQQCLRAGHRIATLLNQVTIEIKK